jgi:hypothetical protein
LTNNYDSVKVPVSKETRVIIMKCKDVVVSAMGLGSIVGIGFGLTNPVILVCALIGGAITIICGCALMEPRQRRVAQGVGVGETETIGSGSVQVVDSGKTPKKPPAILAYAFESIQERASSGKTTIVIDEPEDRPGIDGAGIYVKTVRWTKAWR